ncbi:MAG: hypothetical protein U0324_14430 [Polyangiales bacterium]
MVPCVGAAEFSPDDAFLAWDDGIAPGVVRVTEVASLRTVARLDRGGRVEAMCWSSPDTLCLFRRNEREDRMHVHAIPDGGLVASAPLPSRGSWWGVTGPIQHLPPSRRRMRVQSAPNAGAALFTWPDVKALDPPASLGACLLRGERFETADVVDLAATLTEGDRQARIEDVALSPDGDALAVAVVSPSDAWCALVSCDGAVRARVAMPKGLAPKLMRWVGPASVLTAWGPARGFGETRFMLVEAPATVKTLAISGADFMFGASSDFDFEFDLDPGRENALATALRRTAVRSSTWALVLPTDASSARAATTLPLHAPELADIAYLGGGACWDARGHLLTLTATERSEARLSRRANPTDTPEAVLQLELTGNLPRALSLTPSPTRRHALARWDSQDPDRPGEPRRAVALLALG